MSEPQILEGDLRSFDLPQVLKTLAYRQATGILTIQGEEDIIAVSCLNGHVVTADSLNQTQEESLGELLLHQNLVERSDFDAVALEHKGSGGNLGDLLVGRGLLTREKLLECLRLQTYRLMLQVLTWRRGEFKFYSGDEISYEKGVTPISVEELLIRALADLGERSGVGGEVPRLDAIYRKVPPRGEVRILGRDGTGGPGIWITESQQAFLEGMDGQTSAFDVAKSLGTGRFKTLFSLHQLLQQDLIELVQAATPRKTGPALGATPMPSGALSGAGLATPSPMTTPSSTATPLPRPAPSGVGLAPPAPGPVAPSQPTPSPFRPQPTPMPSAASGVSIPRIETDERALAPAVTPRPWIGAALAALLLLALGFALLRHPSSCLLPYPWQASQRADLQRQMRETLFQKIDRAVATFYLMDLQYPRILDNLVDRGLLSSLDLRDPGGHLLHYTPQELSYQIDIVEGGKAVETHSGSITGDFVLDNDLFADENEKNPLVLLD